MKRNYSKICGITLAVIGGVCVYSTEASAYNLDADSRLGRELQQIKPVREFRGEKPFSINDARNRAIRPQGGISTLSAVEDPFLQFDQTPLYDYLEAPDGSTWLYTSEYEYHSVELSEFYTEEQIKSFTFTIYDNSFNVIGTLHDEINLQDNETRAVSVTLDPQVTCRFFNDDPNPEVMVYYAMNTASYTIHYYYKVYTLGGD